MRTYIILLLAVILILTGTGYGDRKDQPGGYGGYGGRKDRSRRSRYVERKNRSGFGSLERKESASKERKIKKALAKATISCLINKKSTDRAECDRLIDSLLSQEKPSVEAYFVAAQAANLRGKPEKAILILEEVISKHADDKAPGMNSPVKILGRFWIGTLPGPAERPP